MEINKHVGIQKKNQILGLVLIFVSVRARARLMQV